MVWRPDTKPTKANIRHRLSAAQDAINGAMDLIKANPKMGKRDLVACDNAFQWLVEAQRRVA